jgi:AcrR family transcriptional regulator
VSKSRLGPADWARAALDAIAEGGLRAAAVETLVPRVGASKGSFYWHFADHAALIAAAVALWEETATEALIRDLEKVRDPRERLRQLFTVAFGDAGAGRVEVALAADPEHPSIRATLYRVTVRRLAFVADAFVELGYTQSQARHRALVAYSSYLGFFAVRGGNPASVPVQGRSLTIFVSELLDMLTSPEGASARPVQVRSSSGARRRSPE